jgi:hypothetical protein
VENKTTTNTARIKLGAPKETPEAPAAASGPADQKEAEAPVPKEEKSEEGFFSFW